MSLPEKPSVDERAIAILAEIPRRLGFLAPRSSRSLSLHQSWRSRGLSSIDRLFLTLAPGRAMIAQHLTRNVQDAIKLARVDIPAASVAEADYRTEIANLLSGFTPAHLKAIRNRHKTTDESKAFFWSKVHIGSPNECWLFTGSTTPVGNRNNDVYGRACVNGRLVVAHKCAYEYTKGKVPDGLVVRHTCDTFLCCNPHHLICGTQQQNMDDAVERGRIPRGDDSSSRRHPGSRPRGESSGAAKLTAIDVLTMLLMHDAGIGPAPFLSWVFQVSEPQVNLILSGRSWSHIGGDLALSHSRKAQLAAYYAEHVTRPGRKLDKKMIREIRLKFELGWSKAKLAKCYKLSHSHVCRVVSGETWSDVY